MSADQVTVLGIAASCVLLVGILGQLAIFALRKHSLATLLALSSCATLLAVALAVGVDARVMFLSTHDGLVVGLALATAIPLALSLAFSFSFHFRRSIRVIADQARSLTDSPSTAQQKPVFSRELAQIQRELSAAGVAIRAARDQEQALEHSRRQLITGISHDLRTPLAGIAAMAAALTDEVAVDPKRYHRQLHIEAQRLSGMVDTLFLISRLQSNTLPITRISIDLLDLISDAVCSISPLADSFGISISLEKSPPSLIQEIDPSHISRALANLLVNAVRNSQAHSQVSIAVDVLEHEIHLQVQDECGGIPSAEIPRVFELAWRGASARQRGPDGGGGLGLCVAQGLVAAHGGRITVANSGSGCCFTIILPGS